jgi:hypothetical protein
MIDLCLAPNDETVYKTDKASDSFQLRLANRDLKQHQKIWDERSCEYDKRIKELEEEKRKLLDQISYAGAKHHERREEYVREVRRAAEENETLRKRAERNDQVDRAKEATLKGMRELLEDARKERDAVVLENKNLKRKREGSTSPPPPQVKLLVRPQQAGQQAALSPASTELSLPPLHSALAKDPGIGKIDGPMHPPQVPTWTVLIRRWTRFCTLHSALNSFQTKADIISQINASSDHLRLGKHNELVFHRTTVEDQAKLIKKVQAYTELIITSNCKYKMATQPKGSRVNYVKAYPDGMTNAEVTSLKSDTRQALEDLEDTNRSMAVYRDGDDLHERLRTLCFTSPTKHIGLSVIECRELARERYNPKLFYSHEKAMLSWGTPYK